MTWAANTATNFNFDSWDNFAKTAPNPNVKVYLGVPASPSAAGSGYVSSSTLAAAAKEMPECDGLWFMELRHSAVTVLHEAGVDPIGIAGMTGHTEGSVRAILDKHYLIRTSRAAEGAFRKRLAGEEQGGNGGV